MDQISVTRDRFGNPVDVAVGYARGQYLRSSVDDARRLRHCQQLAAQHARNHGPQSLTIFTGNCRDFPLQPQDIDTIAEEWVGSSLNRENARAAALTHLGGQDSDDAAFFNRTSAGLVASIRALSNMRDVLSLVPHQGRAHASVRRGCEIAVVRLHEVAQTDNWRDVLHELKPALVIITTITSELQVINDETIEAMVEAARQAGAIVLLDEAYGARLRPDLLGGRKSLQLGAHLAITNSDKAGMCGPRAGVMAGDASVLATIMASAFELGLEARAPVIAGAWRALLNYQPTQLVEEAKNARELQQAIEVAMPGLAVDETILGGLIHQDSALSYLANLMEETPSALGVTPAEVTTAIGVLLLKNHGLITTNSHGHPGASATLRFKPIHGALEKLGGARVVAQHVKESFVTVKKLVKQPDAMRSLLFGAGN